MDALLAEMRDTVQAALSVGGSVAELAQRVDTAVDALEQAKVSLLAMSQDDPNYAGSVSFNYMMLMGTVCGSWQMLHAATVVARKSDAERVPFHADKAQTAEFYIRNVLPRYLSYAAIIEAGSESTMAMAAGQF